MKSSKETTGNTHKEHPIHSGEETKSIFVAIVGKPNVGKSSLLNRLVGEKVAIVTPKPQTTRTRITGILTKGPVQYVFLDTPGMHSPKTKLGQRMTHTVQTSVDDGDAVLMLFEPAGEFTDPEVQLARSLGGRSAIGVVNKADTVPDAAVLAARMREIEEMEAFQQVVSASAETGAGCDALLEMLATWAVPGPHFFADDAYTDLPEKQLVAEIVREKLLLFLYEELPHGTAVEVERFHERQKGNIVDIDVTIYAEKKSHKGMIIGKGGAMLKQVASAARADCEEMLGAKVNLQCWVKVKDDWRDNENLLNHLGFK